MAADIPEVNAWVVIQPDDTVIIRIARSEMGQGIRTGLPAVLADEMEADWDRIVVEQATGDAKYGDQNTDGSHSVRDFMQRMREAGATVRRMLEQSAAGQWGVDVAECRAQLHTVVHEPSGRVLDYGELVAGAAELPVPGLEQLRFKSRDEFRYIGKGLPIVDMHDMTHGSAMYGADIRLPGMKFAAIARPPVVFGKVKSYDASAALAVAGVEQVVEIPAAEPPAMFKALGGVAVIASNSWAALKGRDLLTIEWDDGPNADYDSASYKTALLETVRQPGEAARDPCGDAATSPRILPPGIASTYARAWPGKACDASRRGSRIRFQSVRAERDRPLRPESVRRRADRAGNTRKRPTVPVDRTSEMLLFASGSSAKGSIPQRQPSAIP